jgi:murein DD-endopeptidase MepM/ murein hydrolase activator NlpD
MPERNQAELHLPFDGSWLVFWGGDTEDLNYHHPYNLQRYAFDFVVAGESGKSYRGDGKQNRDYYAFGQDIIAPAAGVIVEAVDGVRDNNIGICNPYIVTGNCVLIQHTEDEYSFLGHLQQGSVSVKTGDEISRGQKLGKCGNSGNSPEPHLHYHLQDSAEYNYTEPGLNLPLEVKPKATGLKPYFTDILLERNGVTKPRKSCSPIKGDFISNA